MNLLLQKKYSLFYDGIISLLLSISLFYTFFIIESVNGVYYLVYVKQTMPGDWLWVLLSAGGIYYIWQLLLRHAVKCALDDPQLIKYHLRVAVLPVMLLITILVLPIKYYTILSFSYISVFVVFRLVAAWPVALKCRHVFHGRWFWLCVMLFTFIAILYGFHVQKNALDKMYLPYWDWAIFLNSIDNTVDGRWFFSNDEGLNFMARHFSPILLLLVPYVKIFNNVYAFFLLNSIILFSGGPLVYLFCRRQGLTSALALTTAFSYIISPSILNMNLSVMYGFHTIYLFLPVLLLFFTFFENKKYLLAYILFALSLSIKETVGIFWLGVGIAMIMDNRSSRRHGILIAVTGFIWFVCCTKFIQPSFVDGNLKVNSLYRFSHLGTTELAIILSPLTNPGAFWQTLFRSSGIYYLLSLLLPFICLLPARPWLVLGILPILSFTILQDSKQLQNIHLQYQTMPLAMLWCGAVICLKDCISEPNRRWWKYLLLLMNYEQAKKNLLPAASASLLCGCLLGSLFMSINPLGKEKIVDLTNRRDYSADVAKLKGFITKGEQLAAPARLAGHLVLDYDVYTKYYPFRKYMLLDLTDSLTQGPDIEAVRRALLQDRNYRLKYNAQVGPRRWMLFEYMQNAPRPPKTLITMTQKQWQAAGTHIKLKSQLFSVAVKPVFKKGSVVLFRLYFRLNQKVNRDYKFITMLYNDRNQYYCDLHFADGTYPAEMAQPGEIYQVDLRCPSDMKKIKGVRVKVVPLPVPAKP
jgi:uncharacterized membrane protein